MAETLLDIGRIYLMIGGAATLLFCFVAVGRIDPNGENAWVFRPLLVPGVVLLWPLVLYRWMRIAGGWEEFKRHQPPRQTQDRLGIVLAVAIPVILVVCLSARQPNKYEAPAIQLAPPAALSDGEVRQ